jgi:hypothetical protein
LRSLVVPETEVVIEADKLLSDLPHLWDEADIVERRRILITMLDAVYVDNVDEKRVVAIRPKPAFRPLFEIVVTRRDSEIPLISEKAKEGQNGHLPQPDRQEADVDLCFWWRRGRVELPVQQTPRSRYTTGLAGL